DLLFTMYDAVTNGAALGKDVPGATSISNGLFTVTLNFDARLFTGADRWLEIEVRTNGGGSFTTLSPRQALLRTPYAIYASTAGVANTVTNGAIQSGQLGTA